MKFLDVLFVSILRVNRKLDFDTSFSYAVIPLTLSFGFNFASIWIIGEYFRLFPEPTRLSNLFIFIIVGILLNLYYFRNKNYLKIYRKYYNLKFSKFTTVLVILYFFVSILLIFIIGTYKMVYGLHYS